MPEEALHSNWRHTLGYA